MKSHCFSLIVGFAVASALVACGGSKESPAIQKVENVQPRQNFYPTPTIVPQSYNLEESLALWGAAQKEGNAEQITAFVDFPNLQNSLETIIGVVADVTVREVVGNLPPEQMKDPAVMEGLAQIRESIKMGLASEIQVLFSPKGLPVFLDTRSEDGAYQHDLSRLEILDRSENNATVRHVFGKQGYAAMLTFAPSGGRWKLREIMIPNLEALFISQVEQAKKELQAKGAGGA